MEQWLSKNAQAVAELIDNIQIYEHNRDENNQTIKKG